MDYPIIQDHLQSANLHSDGFTRPDRHDVIGNCELTRHCTRLKYSSGVADASAATMRAAAATNKSRSPRYIGAAPHREPPSPATHQTPLKFHCLPNNSHREIRPIISDMGQPIHNPQIGHRSLCRVVSVSTATAEPNPFISGNVNGDPGTFPSNLHPLFTSCATLGLQTASEFNAME